MSGVIGEGHIPRHTTAEIRRRWSDLFTASYSRQSVAHKELERGVHAIVAPPILSNSQPPHTFERQVSSLLRRVPPMSRRVRIALHELPSCELKLDEDYRHWLGRAGADLYSHSAHAVALIDMVYVEAALLDRLHESNVDLDFRVPISIFRRGELIVGENVLDAAASMAFEGRSLIDVAARVADDALRQFACCAEAFLRLSRLYSTARWRIQNETFVMELPGRGISLSLRYWELRNGSTETLKTWQKWIESLFDEGTTGALGSAGEQFAA